SRTSGFREIPDYNGNPRAHIWMQLELEPRPVKETRTMATATVDELRKKSDAAFANVSRQLHGMEPHLEHSDAAGEWTTRQVLCHLLFESGWKPGARLQSFADHDLPVIDIKPGLVDMTAERRAMTLSQLLGALETQKRQVFDYLDGLRDADLGKKARIPLFKQFMGTDEIAIPVYVGALFDYHWNDHAGQLAKIRTATGLPEAK